MTSTMFPWCTEYDMEQLPDWEEIKSYLAFAGDLARAYDIRMTFHPSHFIKLGCDNEDLLVKSLKEMEVHSKVMIITILTIITRTFPFRTSQQVDCRLVMIALDAILIICLEPKERSSKIDRCQQNGR